MKCRIPTTEERLESKYKKILAEQDKLYSMDHDSILLWLLHKSAKYGKVRLRKFWDDFSLK